MLAGGPGPLGGQGECKEQCRYAMVSVSGMPRGAHSRAAAAPYVTCSERPVPTALLLGRSDATLASVTRAPCLRR